MDRKDSAIEIGGCGSELKDGGSLKRPRETVISRSVKQVCSFFQLLWKLGCDDRRRAIHAVKVGLALSLVCVLMILEPTYNEIGKNTVWAVMTVIVIFEFTAGATLSKGLNRGFGTFVAAALALGISHLSVLAGEQAEPVIVGISVFIIGAGATFARFVPKIKAKFDYGVVIFLLTFCMILVLGYQDIDSVRTSLDRLFTICIGCSICLLICLLVCPIWAGEDLHRLIINNLQTLSLSLKECVTKYVSDGSLDMHLSSRALMGEQNDDPIYNFYRGALLSGATEESLANFASWEPPHGRFKLRHPWKKYVKVGVAMRHCAYGIVALHSCLHSDAQAPLVLRQVFTEELLLVATEAAAVLQELSETIETMRSRSTTTDSLHSAAKAARSLQKLINGRARVFFSSDVIATSIEAPPPPDFIADAPTPTEAAARTTPDYSKLPESADHPAMHTEACRSRPSASLMSLATFASLLVEVVARLELLTDAVAELAKAAQYKTIPEGKSKVGDFEQRNRKELPSFNNNNVE